MSASTQANGAKGEAFRDLYDVGQIPPAFHVPEKMWAWTIRKERHGRPAQAMQLEVVPTHTIGEDEVLILVMAGGVNYNGVWAALGEPVSTLDFHKQPFHIAGSDAAGIVWAVGSKVKRWKPGDEVVVHCNQDDGDDEECNGGDPMFSPSQRIWGYETPDGAFAQFARVQARQLMARPKHLTWEESACYTLTLATAYRMLFGFRPNILKPGQNVLVWGEQAVPVIAAVHGVAFGAGFQLALGADIRLVAPDARMAILEIKWGLIPDMGAYVLLSGLIRDDLARELTYTGRIFSGEEAVALGLAARTSADPYAEALTLAREIAGKSPDAIRAAKRLFEGARTWDRAHTLREETREQVALIGSANQKEAIMANLEKRSPRFADPA